MNNKISNNLPVERRNTRQRVLILNEIRAMKTHPTAEEIFLKLKLVVPNISISTVYRNLEILKLMGLVKKLESVTGQSRFDGTTCEHHHVRCIQCGKIEDIMGLSIPNDLLEAKKYTNFRLLESKTEFLGLCPQCEEENRNKNLSTSGYCEKKPNNL